MYHRRLATERFLELLRHFPAVAVVGARQVGKTTFVRHVLDGVDCVTFDPLVDVENARAEPELFLDHHRTPLFLDEIQFAPELVPALKRRIDGERTPGRFVLSGSQQWSVMRSLAESLAGRVAFLDLEGFCLTESADRAAGTTWLESWLADAESFVNSRPERLPPRRSLYEQLWRGSLPEADTLDERLLGDFHSAYQRTYVERDARLAGNVADWQEFGRFFRLAAALTACEVNHSHLGRELGLSPQTARRWLEMLSATFQWHEVPAWSGNVLKRVSGKPKGYVADTGVAAAALRISSPTALADHPSLGALFETAVVAEVRRLSSVLPTKPLLHHWRSHGGAEVDLLLERDGVLFPIEIKATARPTRSAARGIAAFRETHPKLRIARGLVLAPVASVTPLSERDTALPWDLAPS
jgi:predicted AAA+ superfamily ATPase